MITTRKIVLLLSTLVNLVACMQETNNGQRDINAQTKPVLYAETPFPYTVVSTGLKKCFGNSPNAITCPKGNHPFSGQDANYESPESKFIDNGDGTITDLTTSLMWQKGFTSMSWQDAQEQASNVATGGYHDWRVPTTKELYSLINFAGNQGHASPSAKIAPADAVPFIDTTFFDFEYPNDRRYIDAQYVTCTVSAANIIDDVEAFYSVNFADGRIKGYPTGRDSGHNRNLYVRYVRGNPEYGQNRLIDNSDGTISDVATGLMWSSIDSLKAMSWKEGLTYAENLNFAGYGDWRMPNIKELQSIVDYNHGPDATGKAAISPQFDTTIIKNEAGELDYPFFWSSTSLNGYPEAATVQFGRSLGYIPLPTNDQAQFLGVHGSGAQRTNPKTGMNSYGRGPQGDIRRVKNFVRVVRNIY